MLYPGETITQTFDVPYAADSINKAIVTYKQANRVRLEKTVTAFTEVDESNASLTVALSQEDSLKLIDNAAVRIQINLYLTDTTRDTIDLDPIDVGEQFYRRIIT